MLKRLLLKYLNEKYNKNYGTPDYDWQRTLIYVRSDWKKFNGADDFYKNSDRLVIFRGRNSSLKKIKDVTETISCYKNKRILDYRAGLAYFFFKLDPSNIFYYFDVPGKLQDTSRHIHNYYGTKINYIEDPFVLKYDIIICINVLDRVPEPIQELSKLTNCLEQGGFLVTNGMNFIVGNPDPLVRKENAKFITEYKEFMKDNYDLLHHKDSYGESIYTFSKKYG